MASIYSLKPAFQRLLRPVTRWLAGLGVTANHVTVSAAALSCSVGATIAWVPQARWPLLLMPAALFVRMALNAIDGILAREHGMQSRLGAVLNELGDVASDAALYLPLALVPGMPAALLVLVVLFAVIGEMAGVLAVQIGAHRRYDGPMGKSDRAFVFGCVSLLIGAGVPAGPWLHILLGVTLLLSAWTIVNRARHALLERA
jgi:phosphatidylglycerophosphate synthase